jgi:hypothetical protein
MTPGAEASAALVRSDVLVLLREKRYEEALARLYQARAESPGSVELQKGIDQVKEFLIGAYAKRLGGLDQVAKQMPPAAGRSPDMVLLSRYIDGATSYGDLAEICPLGRMRTLQVLVDMYAPKSGASGEREAHSGPRPLEAVPSSALPRVEVVTPTEEPMPETARSGSSLPPPGSARLDDTPEAREYRDAFGRGTAAFIQKRFADAVAAFEECGRLRPGDGASDVMLRRARRDLESHW